MRQTDLPEIYLDKMRQLLGKEYEAYLDSFLEEPASGLRFHRGKIKSREELPFSLAPVPWIPNGCYDPGEERLSKDPYYYAGLYYLQEPSAMTPAELLPVEPGDMVLDLCAAPGGKSTELGVKLNGRGMLCSNDISNSRAKALLKNLELFGIPNICVTSETPERLADVFPEFFDKILVDAPCSGEGMFRKDADMVKSWLEHGPEYYGKIQRDIIRQAVSMLKPGGLLMYSTCTFDRMEDEAVIEELLEEHRELALVPLPLFDEACDGFGLSGCIRLFPHRIHGEGHFLAMIQKAEKRTDTQPYLLGENAEHWFHPAGWNMQPGDEDAENRPQTTDREKRSGSNMSREKRAAGAFAPLPQDAAAELSQFLEMVSIPFDKGRFVIKGTSIYYLPEGFPKGASLRYLRTGLLMGEWNRGRFEPSQALAMTLGAGTFSNAVSFSREDERVIRYLIGETISLLETENSVEGWCLVCVDGFSLGFAKGMGRSLKNKYYPGWRWQ